MEITEHEPAKPGFWWVTVGRNSRSNNPLISLTQIWYIRRMKNDFLDLAVGMETEEPISLGRLKIFGESLAWIPDQPQETIRQWFTILHRVE